MYVIDKIIVTNNDSKIFVLVNEHVLAKDIITLNPTNVYELNMTSKQYTLIPELSGNSYYEYEANDDIIYGFDIEHKKLTIYSVS